MMPVKKYLQRYREATLNLESLSAEHERIMSVLYSITSDPSSDGGGGAGPKDKLGDGVAVLCDLVRSIDDEIMRYASVRDEVLSVVREVMRRDIVLGQCLHYRYVDFRSAYATANDMGYTPGYERSIHKRALAMARDIVNRSGKLRGTRADIVVFDELPLHADIQAENSGDPEL